jgi:hypothetical protein
MIVTSDSGLTVDYFAYNASGSVWNGSAYVAWADGDFATYRIAATEVGTSGRYSGTLPSDAVTFELRERGVTAALSFPRVVGETVTLAAIEAKTGLITEDTVYVVPVVTSTGGIATAPNTTDGNVKTIVRGDDYTPVSRLIRHAIPALTDAGAVGACTTKFAAWNAQLGLGWEATGTVEDIGGGLWQLKTGWASAATLPCKPNVRYEYTHTLFDSLGRVRTQRNGSTLLIDGYAVPRFTPPS